MVDGAPQKELRARWMVWKPTPADGNCTAPARHPLAWLPMMWSGPGAGVSAAAARLRAASIAATTRAHPERLSESSLEHLEDIAGPEEGLGPRSALDRLALA